MAITAGPQTFVRTQASVPTIVALAGGGWVEIWEVTDDPNVNHVDINVYSQAFNADGSAMSAVARVNTYLPEGQAGAQVVALADGGWVVAWTSSTEASFLDDPLTAQDGSGPGVYQQVYNANGSKRGGETLVNTTTGGGQTLDGLIALEGGGWVVSWSGDSYSGFDYWQQVYTANGAPQLGKSRINTYEHSSGSGVDLAALDDGGWALSWAALGEFTNGVGYDGPDGSGWSILARQYGAGGGASGVYGSERVVNTTTQSDQTAPRVTALDGGGWLATWLMQTSGGLRVYQQAHSSTGQPVGPETLVINSTQTFRPYDVVALENGGWLVTWNTAGGFAGEPGADVYQRAYKADGTPLTDEATKVNSYVADSQSFPVVGTLPNGGWVVVWQSTGQFDDGQDGSWSGIYQQVFNTDGTRNGGEMRVNTTTEGFQDLPKLTILADGRWMVTWESSPVASGAADIHRKVFSLDNGAAPSKITGKISFTEGEGGTVGTLKVVDADDTSGFTWALLNNAGGRFAINATTGKVTVKKPILLDYEQSRTHAITAQVTDKDGNSFTKVLTAKGTDVAMEELQLSAKADKVWGGSKVDKFDGGKGDDTLKGGGGRDVLDGGKGKDTADYSEKTKSVEVTLDASRTATVQVGGKAENSIKNIENIVGGTKADKLTGDGASNTFYGRQGKDTLDGKGGRDFFVFDTALGPKNVDTIEGFKAKDDTILLDDAIFTALGLGSLSGDAFRSNKSGQAADASDRIIYEKDTGKLFYDADGDGAGARVQFAVLTGKPTIAHEDLIIV